MASQDQSSVWAICPPETNPIPTVYKRSPKKRARDLRKLTDVHPFAFPFQNKVAKMGMFFFVFKSITKKFELNLHTDY